MDCRIEIFDHGKVGTSHEEYSLVTSYFLLESRGMYCAWILYYYTIKTGVALLGETEHWLLFVIIVKGHKKKSC